jgi:hypothetical protein
MGGKIRRQADDMCQIEWAEKFDAKRTTYVKKNGPMKVERMAAQ